MLLSSIHKIFLLISCSLMLGFRYDPYYIYEEEYKEYLKRVKESVDEEKLKELLERTDKAIENRERIDIIRKKSPGDVSPDDIKEHLFLWAPALPVGSEFNEFEARYLSHSYLLPLAMEYGGEGYDAESIQHFYESAIEIGMPRKYMNFKYNRKLIVEILRQGHAFDEEYRKQERWSLKNAYKMKKAIESYSVFGIDKQDIFPPRDPAYDSVTIDLIQRADEKGIIDQLTERRFGGEVNEALIEYCRTKADDGTLNGLIYKIFPYLDDPAVAEYLISLMKKGTKNNIIKDSLWALKNYSNQEEIAGKLAEIYTNGDYYFYIGQYINLHADIDYATRKKLLKKMERANPNLRVNWEVVNQEAKSRGELIEVDGELVVPPGKSEKEPVDHGEARPGAPGVSPHEKKSDELEKTDVESDSSWLKAGLIFFVIVILVLLPILALKKKRKTD